MDTAAIIKNQKAYLEKHLCIEKKSVILCALSAEIRKIKREYQKISESREDSQDLFDNLTQLTNRLDLNKWFRRLNKLSNIISDIKFYLKNRGNYFSAKTALKRAEAGYIAICSAIKNEAEYIDEWIAFYKLMGVDHLFLFDNGSTDNVRSVLKMWIDEGYVSLIDYPGAQAQLPAFRIAMKGLAGKFRWVALIDADEFLFPTDDALNLRDYFTEMEDYPAVGVNWVVYGPGEHDKKPEGLVTENYVHTFENSNNEMNLRIKTIANPCAVYDVTSPHFCVLKKGRYGVDENGNNIDTRWMIVSNSGPAFTRDNSTKIIRINHYWTKSKEELREKCNRGYAAGAFNPRYDDIMQRVSFPQKCDDIAKRYSAKIRELLKN